MAEDDGGGGGRKEIAGLNNSSFSSPVSRTHMNPVIVPPVEPICEAVTAGGVKGKKGHVSASETAVAALCPADNLRPIFPADITSTASFMPPSKRDPYSLNKCYNLVERRSSFFKGETMPKSLHSQQQQQEKEGNLKALPPLTTHRVSVVQEEEEEESSAIIAGGAGGWRSHNLAVILEVDDEDGEY